MRILAIETSCDDTGIAILEIKGNKNSPDFRALSNIVASQIETHKPYGGVYPFLAKREHLKNLPVVLKKALKEAKILNPEKEIDLVAVTQGPGLEPCLWTGVNFAKELSKSWKIPIIPVNHIEAHILVNFLEYKKIDFPAICLVVSGGHTQLILMKKVGSYKILSETRDDAAGECFDKCAKILGLGYPGGPEIAKLASRAVIPGLSRNPDVIARTPPRRGTKQSLDSRFRGNDISLPRPMINSKDYDFSFSGLKTAVLYLWQKIDDRQKDVRSKIASEFAAEIQQAIIDVLIKKTIKAAKDFKAKSIILGGGVSANCELRSQFKSKIKNQKSKINLLFPLQNLSTDNAVMTAIAGYFHRTKKISAKNLRADANLRIK